MQSNADEVAPKRNKTQPTSDYENEEENEEEPYEEPIPVMKKGKAKAVAKKKAAVPRYVSQLLLCKIND